jgi:hypothetical protein
MCDSLLSSHFQYKRKVEFSYNKTNKLLGVRIQLENWPDLPSCLGSSLRCSSCSSRHFVKNFVRCRATFQVGLARTSLPPLLCKDGTCTLHLFMFSFEIVGDF